MISGDEELRVPAGGDSSLPRSTSTVARARKTAAAVDTLSWKDIGLDRPSSRHVHSDAAAEFSAQKATRPILHNVSAHVERGSLLGILGPSGCGKTSLLEVLADQRQKTRGEIRVNGALVQPGEWRSLAISSFVEQSDVVLGSMTVRENLMFYANLKMADLTVEERRERVEALMEEVGLTECADVLTGSAFFKAISGGQKRRLSLAIGLLAEPDILFADEVTSGLDASTALQIAALLRQLADAGRIIVCTIHQPRSAIFALFDKILLLAGGETVFFGEREAAVQYFAERTGYVVHDDDNPADFYADVLTQYDVPDAHRQLRLQRIKDAYADSPLRAAVMQSIQETSTDVPVRQVVRMNAATEKLRRAQTAGWFLQYWLLVKRALLRTIRDPMVSIALVMQILSIALLYGIVYLNVGFSQSAISSRLGFLAIVSIKVAFVAASSVAIAFVEEKALVLRERANNMYKLSAYYFAAITADLPTQIILPFAQLAFLYFMIPLREGGFWIAVGILFALFQVASALGYLISVVAPNFTIAITILPLTIVMNLLFSGMPVIKSSMPLFLRWVTHISFLRQTFAALMVNEFGAYSSFSCSSAEIDSHRCLYSSGADVLADYEITSGIGPVVAILAALYVVYRTLGFLCMRLQERNMRKLSS